ncbi:MAG: LysR family transcriptional regulator [Thermodesulfobacteriota bacterium]
MDLTHLQTFLAVAGRLSFRRAAEALHYAPSTVSAQVKALEEELGAALFERLGRRVLLTEAGRRLLPHARRMADLAAEARSCLGAGGAAPGELCVRISETLGLHCLPAVLARFRRGFAAVRLTLLTASGLGLGRDLRQGATDLALILGEADLDPGLSVEVLGRAHLRVMAAPGSDLAGRGRVGAAGLAGRDLVLTPHVWGLRRGLEQAILAAGVRPSGVVECGSLELVKRCVAAGLGVGFAPDFALEAEAARGELEALDWADGRLDVPVLLARNADRDPSPAARAFTAAARQFFAEQGGA